MTRAKRAQSPPESVAAKYAAYAHDVGAKLRDLRRMILDVAAKTPGVGELEETLKWGQPSFLTSATKSGSTIRIDQLKAQPGHYAIYFHCQTGLVETFREHYRDELRFEGNRAIILNADENLPEAPLRHCIALALTYHARKITRQRRQISAD